MASKRGLTFRIHDFLKYRNWTKLEDAGNYIIMRPPKNLSVGKKNELKIAKFRDATDYCDHMDLVLNVLEKIYRDNNSQRTVKKYKEVNSRNRRKYMNKNEWIGPEEQSLVKKIGVEEVYLPNFNKFSLNLLDGKPQ